MQREQVVVIFLPFLPIKIGDALMVTMALDVAGAVLGWRRFDHFGHLGGCCPAHVHPNGGS